MTTPLLNLKTHLPLPVEGWVDRARLRALLNQSFPSRRRVVLVSAMAGSGKSTLLTNWAASSNLAFAWVSLDARDSTFPIFWAYLISAIQHCVPDFAQTLLTQLLSPQPPSAEMVLLEFLNHAAGLSNPVVLVLDDYHLITSTDIHESLVYLVEHLPPSLLVVLCTRSDPPMPLSRWRVRGYLTEIRVDHLRFNQEEAASFLRGYMNLRLDDEDIAHLETSTEGWAAGLQMAALALQNIAPLSESPLAQDDQAQKRFIARFSANNQYVFDYLTSEVLNQQQPEMREFLLQTSILKQLSGPLCEAVTGNPDSAEILTLLRQKNLFVIPQDSEGIWFRYHHLFADLLQTRLARLDPEIVAQMHLRAANWYDQAGRVDDTLYHALQAKAFDYAADVVNRSWRLATDRGWPNLAMRWLETLPAETVEKNPQLSLAAACTQWLRGKAEETQRHCDNALEAYQAWTAAGKGPSGDAEFDTIPSQAAAMQALVAVRRERLDEAVRLSRKAVELSRESSPASVGLAYQGLATALRDQGKFEEAIQAYRTAILSFRKTTNRITVTNSSFNLGRLLMVQGRLSEAEQFFQEALSWAGKANLTPADGILQVYLADIFYERNQTEQARELLEQAWSQASKSGYLELIKNASILKARLLRYGAVNAGEGISGAIQVLEEAAAVVRRTDARSLLGEIQSVLAFYQAEAGQIEPALAWAQTVPTQTGDHLPGLSTGFQQLNLARMNLAAGRLDAVLEFAVPFERLSGASGSNFWQIEALLLIAQTYAKTGKLAQAHTAMGQALALTCPEGYIRLFVDAGDPIRELLQGIYPTLSDPAARYAGRLLDAFSPPPKPDQPQVGQKTQASWNDISERETQVLRLLSRGLSNQEIADQLVISLATTKTHLRHIFDKLDAQNRVDAINRAKELGLI